MTALLIRTLPKDSVLRQKANKVSRIDSSIQRLIDNMVETMQQANSAEDGEMGSRRSAEYQLPVCA